MRTALLFVAFLFGCQSGLEHPESLNVFLYLPKDSEFVELVSRDAATPNDNASEFEQLEHAAVTAIRQGKFDAAVEKLDAAIASYESSSADDNSALAKIYARRGIANWYLREHQRAADDYSRAIDLDPDQWEFYFHRWMTYERLGESGKAAADRERGMQLRPEVFERNWSPDGGVI
jgi:tetratricopeptide (TPR) repeat protein